MEVNNSAEVNTAQSYCNQRGCQRHINVSQLMLTWQNSNQNMYNLSFKFEKVLPASRTFALSPSCCLMLLVPLSPLQNTTITPHAPLTWGVDHLTLAFDTQDNPDFVDYANQTEYGGYLMLLREEHTYTHAVSPPPPSSSDTVTAIFDTGLFKGVPVNESYQCNSTSTYSLDSSTVGTLSVSVSICDWSTQAFWFETDNGTYANGASSPAPAANCLATAQLRSSMRSILLGHVMNVFSLADLRVGLSIFP